MPNHVRNVVRMKGIAKEPLFYVDEFHGESFDFNKLIPMPSILDGTVAGSRQEDALRALVQYAKQIGRHPIVAVSKDADIDDVDLDLVKDGMRYVTAKLETGFTDWYDWSVTNWGTKWNAYELKIEGEDEIVFDTAWSPPLPVIAALAERYPDRHIEHFWADEAIDDNAGHMEYDNGDQIGGFAESDSEAYEYAHVCWGNSECLYQDERGRWCKHVCEETCKKCFVA